MFNKKNTNPTEPVSLQTTTLAQKKISVYWLLALVPLGIALAYSSLRARPAIAAPAASDDACPPHSVRRTNTNLIKPLMYVESPCQSARLEPLRKEISEVIEDFKSSGDLTDASVYLRDMEHSEWICVNEKLQFQPSSLIKVPVMMAYFRMAERDPGLLDRSFVAKLPDGIKPPKQTFTSQSITFGQTYTLRELLRYVIAYSDNNATAIINNEVDIPTVEHVFTDLGLPKPDLFSGPNFNMTAKDYAIFLRAIFNATYLSEKDSEYAASLMSQCDFDKGFRSGFPQGTKLFHKFGEGGNKTQHQLHEAGVVYLNGLPYVLVVMTRGKVVSKLPKVIESVAKTVYGALGSNT